MSRNPVQKARQTFAEYPTQFWTLTGAAFIDQVGGWLLFPFFSLYVTDKFAVGLTEVGIVFGLFSVAAIVGSTIGGALSDRWGRKSMIITGLLTSAISSLSMIFITDLNLFYGVAFFLGLFSSFGQPAQQAMVADILPESQRAEGFSIMRVAANLAVTFGPALGGMIAARSFAYLFVGDAVTSIITAFIVLRVIDESRPEPKASDAQESLAGTFRGYAVPLRDRVFALFMVANILANIVYMQLNSVLPVYLRDQHGFDPQFFGLLLMLNAAMVVVLQIYITRRLRGFAPMVLMAVGTVLSGLGFGLFGVVTVLSGFVLATIILTVGEMIVTPVSQAVVAALAPDAMRGRYMAVFGFVWTLPTIFGPLLAGIVMDNFNPNLVWYASFILGLISALMFLLLRQPVGSRPQPEVERALPDE